MKKNKDFMKKIVIYNLCIFLITCTKPPVSVDEARMMETRSYPADQTELMKASLLVMQDMYYTIDQVDNDLGLITATKLTEGFQAKTRKEPDTETVSIWKKIGITIVVVAIIGAIIKLISGSDSSDSSSSDNHNHSHHGHGSGLFFNNSNDGQTVYRYKVTLTINGDDVLGSAVRVSAQGEKIKGDSIIHAGPIHEPEFFENFYAGLDKEIYN